MHYTPLPRIPASLPGAVLWIVLLISGCNIFKTDNNESNTSQDLLLIAEGNFMYIAEPTAAYTDTDSELRVHIFNAAVREKVGDQVPRESVAATRVKPPEGWGSRPVALQYLWEGNWVYTQKAVEFADHYLVSLSEVETRKVALSDVRFSILVHR